MTEENILDYSRQSIVNRVFAIAMILIFAVAIWTEYTSPDGWETLLIVYIGIPVGIVFLSMAFGVASKRAIDYKPGKWEKKKVWLSFSEYESILESYEDAYSHLYPHESGCGCCCILILAPAFGILAMLYKLFSQVLINEFVDTIILVSILYGIIGVAGFLIGFRIPQIDEEEFFKPPANGDTYEFASELAEVPGIRVGVNVTLGERGTAKAIIDAEVKAYVEGLPETVQIQVQVSQSGFAYPYLIGTAYKGPVVKDKEETLRIGTRYPALFEYSMDDDVAVIVARFKIPSKSSSVPRVSGNDFRELAAALVRKIKELH